jgi:hypothetical protein
MLSSSCADRPENWQPSSSHLPERPSASTRSCHRPRALFYLNCPKGPVDLRENYGFSTREIIRIIAALTKHVAELCTAWKEIHDNH